MRFTKRCVSVLLLTAMLSLPAFADQTGSVTGSYVYLRSGPGTSYDRIGGCAKGTSVTILGSQNGWYQVSVNGMTGYISAEYIQTKAAPAAKRYGTVTGSLVNIRAGAGSEHARVAQAKKGDRVEILGQKGDWYQICAENGQIGYISAEYVRVETPATSTTTPPATTPSTTTEPAPAEKTGVVTGSLVNLRAAPSTAGAIVGTAKKEERLTVLGSESGWYRVRKGSTTAYIHSDYLRIESQPAKPPAATTTTPAVTTPSTAQPAAGQYIIVTGSVVNLRSEASTSSTIVGKAYQGEKYLVSAVSGKWYRISAGSQLAYIHGDYVKADAAAAPAQTGIVTGSLVNIRAGAGSEHARVARAQKGDKVTILGQTNGWYKISTENGQIGYISAEYVRVETPATTATTPSATTPPETSAPPETAFVPGSFDVTPLADTGVITGTYVNIRQYPTTDAPALALVAKGKFVEITGSVDGKWYQITYGSISGYIDAQYVQPGVTDYTRPVSGVISGESGSGLVSGIGYETNTLDLAEQICEYAKTFIGTPYVYGGSLPETGFDCSGFTKYVYAHFGITIPRMQQYDAGPRVTKDSLQPGDLVFFKTNGVSISHVGMYIGYGKFIHAPSAGRTVCITDLNSDYYAARFVCATRILK